MAKTLCDWSKKEIERDFEKLCTIVANPRYLCRKCARSAGSSKHLCKPRNLPSGEKAGSASGPDETPEPEPIGKKH